MSDTGRLIAGTSGSPGSLRALRYAEVMARARSFLMDPSRAGEGPRTHSDELGHEVFATSASARSLAASSYMVQTISESSYTDAVA